jgi:hypothetical protein
MAQVRLMELQGKFKLKTTKAAEFERKRFT